MMQPHVGRHGAARPVPMQEMASPPEPEADGEAMPEAAAAAPGPVSEPAEQEAQPLPAVMAHTGATDYALHVMETAKALCTHGTREWRDIVWDLADKFSAAVGGSTNQQSPMVVVDLMVEFVLRFDCHVTIAPQAHNPGHAFGCGMDPSESIAAWALMPRDVVAKARAIPEAEDLVVSASPNSTLLRLCRAYACSAEGCPDQPAEGVQPQRVPFQTARLMLQLVVAAVYMHTAGRGGALTPRLPLAWMGAYEVDRDDPQLLLPVVRAPSGWLEQLPPHEDTLRTAPLPSFDSEHFGDFVRPFVAIQDALHLMASKSPRKLQRLQSQCPLAIDINWLSLESFSASEGAPAPEAPLYGPDDFRAAGRVGDLAHLSGRAGKLMAEKEFIMTRGVWRLIHTFGMLALVPTTRAEMRTMRRMLDQRRAMVSATLAALNVHDNRRAHRDSDDDDPHAQGEEQHSDDDHHADHGYGRGSYADDSDGYDSAEGLLPI